MSAFIFQLPYCQCNGPFALVVILHRIGDICMVKLKHRVEMDRKFQACRYDALPKMGYVGAKVNWRIEKRH